MSRIAIATDSNSGITQAQAKELGIFVLPMPFYINDELFLEDITLTQEQFYQKMEEGADVKTTQPAPGDVIEFWDKLLRDYDEIVHIPMSSGLSSTCETAEMLSEDYGGKVQVVNNQRISVTQRQSALDALALAAAGWSAREIKELLEKTKFDSDIYITVDTLKYLKKGGRCTPAAAAIGTVLGIKPVLALKDGEIKLVDKGRGRPGALVAMFKQLDALGGIDPRYGYTLLYSDNKQLIAPVHHYMHQNLQLTGGRVAQLGPTIGTHVGPGVVGVVFVAKE